MEAAPLPEPAAMSKRGWITSILNTPFFCHRFKTRTILLYKQRNKQIKMISQRSGHTFPRLSRWLFQSYPVLYGTETKVLESSRDVFGEPRTKDVFVWSELVSGLPHNGIHHVQASHFILRLTLGESRGRRKKHFTFSGSLRKNCFAHIYKTKSAHLFDKLFHNLDHVFVELRERGLSECVFILIQVKNKKKE